jgi:hypothetical protein
MTITTSAPLPNLLEMDATVMSTIFEMAPDKLARFAGLHGLNGISLISAEPLP